ncbi:MAG: hypothetical protein VYE22_07645 [Myxococcota bacterium]|nr:hypothetical protein [Myxococcota bacterium]
MVGLIKSRPKVRVRVPNEIRPGDTFLVQGELICRKLVDVEWVRVTLLGTERWSTGSGDSRVSRSQTLVSLGAEVMGARILEAGTYPFEVRIPLPADAPPTYRGAAGRIDYELRVTASVPWWPDTDTAFDIRVIPPARPSLETETQIYSSNPAGAPMGSPHAEVSLASQWTRIGHGVEGAIALANVDAVQYSEIKVGLRGVETLWDAGAPRTTREAFRYVIRLGAESAREGEMLPFRFRLPDDAPPELPEARRPGGAPPLVTLAWELEAVIGVRWGSDLTLRMPYRVLPPSDRPGDAPQRLAPPTVGSDRLRLFWSAIGERHGLRYEAQSLRGVVGETALVVRRDHRGRDGVHLMAELSYPELHLDLEVEPATSVQKMVGGGKRIGDPSWDRGHYVIARDEGQVARVLRQLLPASANAQLQRMDDRALVVSVRDAGDSPARLERFVLAAAELARQMERVRGAIPPPSGLEDAVDAWRRLAGQIGGQLETARMRVTGTVATLPVEARVSFDREGAPQTTWLSVESPTPLDPEHARVWHPGEGEAAAGLHPEAGALLDAITRGALSLQITERRVMIELPSLLGVGELDDRDAGHRLSRMAQLVQLLRGKVGPYR